MDCNTLPDFRHGLYGCFARAGDALMNANDALLSDTAAHSFVELSLSAFFARRWPSLYGAFEDAKIDRDALRHLFAEYVPAPASGKRLLIGADASSIARPQSKTAADRTYVHQSNLPEGAKPVRAGWQFSTLSVLPEEPSSWTYVLDNQRIPSNQTQGEVAAQQLREIVPFLPGRPLFAGDGYYGSSTFLQLTEGIACDKLTRFAKNRVLYRAAPPRTGKRGHPKMDGAPFKCKDAATHGSPDAHWRADADTGKHVEVDAWNNLHFRDARHIRVSVVRVTRLAAKDTKRDPRVSWFLFEGKQMPPLSEVTATYARRYSQEHGYRVDKQDLLWESVRLRTPEAFENWTDIVASVRNQLCLARPIVQAMRQPWESKDRSATPQQVRRAMGRILIELGTPAKPVQPRGKSPGWLRGRQRAAVPTYPVIKKQPATRKAGRPKPKRRARYTTITQAELLWVI
jgi:hypothetical protein